MSQQVFAKLESRGIEKELPVRKRVLTIAALCGLEAVDRFAVTDSAAQTGRTVCLEA